MTTTEIIEWNKIIAEFDGWSEQDGLMCKQEGSTCWRIDLEDFQYHSNWNQLMPVVEKIAGIPSISVKIFYYTVEHSDKMVCVCEIKKTYWPEHAIMKEDKLACRLEFTDNKNPQTLIWEQVVQFIQWYNTKNK